MARPEAPGPAVELGHYRGAVKVSRFRPEPLHDAPRNFMHKNRTFSHLA